MWGYDYCKEGQHGTQGYDFREGADQHQNQ
jgi:hypothetical protein